MLKKIWLICSFVLMVLLAFSGCSKEEQQHMTMFKTSNSTNTTIFEITDNVLKISGTTDDLRQKYLMVIFDKDNENASKIAVASGKYESEIQLPDKNNVLIELYSGEAEYGTFESIILDFVKAEKTNDLWAFVKSPVYALNQQIFSFEKDSSEYLGETEFIQSSNIKIKELAEEITLDITDQYNQVKAIHDWVATNIYYDYDALSSGNYQNMDAENVLRTKRGVCEGYANLMAALVRSKGIPCRVQGGYALGIDTNKEWSTSNIDTTESNHAWNEVYVNGQWIIIDATWDSQNQYRSGNYEKGKNITQIYFDSTMEFFSLSHKLIDENVTIE